jgi:hypothetical protein
VDGRRAEARRSLFVQTNGVTKGIRPGMIACKLDSVQLAVLPWLS